MIKKILLFIAGLVLGAPLSLMVVFGDMGQENWPTEFVAGIITAYTAFALGPIVIGVMQVLMNA